MFILYLTKIHSFTSEKPKTISTNHVSDKVLTSTISKELFQLNVKSPTKNGSFSLKKMHEWLGGTWKYAQYHQSSGNRTIKTTVSSTSTRITPFLLQNLNSELRCITKKTGPDGISDTYQKDQQKKKKTSISKNGGVCGDFLTSFTYITLILIPDKATIRKNTQAKPLINTGTKPLKKMLLIQTQKHEKR